jgi:hypothetical protein
MLAKGTGKKQPDAVLSAARDTLATSVTTLLKRGETTTFHVVMGLADGRNTADVSKLVNNLFVGADWRSPAEGLFAQQWQARLPNLSAEKDEVLRHEMLWNAHMVEASAAYSDYYKEPFIPQGTVYAYHFGAALALQGKRRATLLLQHPG